MHRDGVDRVAVFLIERCNVVAGTTRIAIDDDEVVAEFTLIDPLDAAFYRSLAGAARRDPDYGPHPRTRDTPGCARTDFPIPVSREGRNG